MKKYIIIFLILLFLNILWFYTIYIKQLKRKRDIITITDKNINTVLNSGDILLFRSDFPNWKVKYIFGDEFTHSAIVYKDSKTNIPYIIESVGESDYFKLGEKSKGVNVIPAYTKLKTYNGMICLKKLNKPLDKDRCDKFTNLIDEYKNYKFQIPSLYDIVKKCILLIDNDSQQREKVGSIFCSMLVAKIINELDIVKLTTSDNCIRPQCFVDMYRHSRFIDGYGYEDLCQIDIT